MQTNVGTANRLEDQSKVECLENLWPNLSEEEKEGIKCVLMGKMEKLFTDRLKNFVNVRKGSAFGWGGKIVSIKLPEVGEFKGFDFEGLLTGNCPNHPYSSWKDKNSDIYKNIYEDAEIEELIRKIRQYKKKSGFYVDEDCSNIFETQEAKSLADILLKIMECSDGYVVSHLWVKDKNREVSEMYVSSSYGFSNPWKYYDSGRLLVHTRDVDNHEK